jgi:hypothetical protein
MGDVDLYASTALAQASVNVFVLKTKLCMYVTGKYVCMEPKTKTGYKWKLQILEFGGNLF